KQLVKAVKNRLSIASENSELRSRNSKEDVENTGMATPSSIPKRNKVVPVEDEWENDSEASEDGSRSGRSRRDHLTNLGSKHPAVNGTTSRQQHLHLPMKTSPSPDEIELHLNPFVADYSHKAVIVDAPVKSGFNYFAEAPSSDGITSSDTDVSERYPGHAELQAKRKLALIEEHVPSEILMHLRFPSFWDRDPSQWGGICDWDIFFINQIPEAKKHYAHHSLAGELKILLQLPRSSPAYQRASLLRPSLEDCDRNQSNISLWTQHMNKLAELAVNNRVDMRNIEGAAFTTGSTVVKKHFEIKTANLLRRERLSKLRETTKDAVNNPFLVSNETKNKSNKVADQDESEFYAEPESQDFISISEDLRSDNGSEYTLSFPFPHNISDTDDEKLKPLSPSQLKHFAKSYAKMSQSLKWVLSSGTCVEDVLFRKGNRLPVESSFHSWIIDLGDWETEKLFTAEDWHEIKRAACIQPKVDEYLARSLARFRSVRTTADLRKVLETTSYRNEDELYNRDRHFDAEWVENVMRHFLTEYEDPDEALKRGHLEGWFDANVWAVIVDRAFRNVSGLEVVRKESASKAVSTRKNRERARKDKTKIGRRLDGIFRTYNNVEYGSIEVAKTFIHVNSTKRLTDGLKLGKTMHDMLVCLNQLVKFDAKKVRRLQVVGLLHSGLKLQVCRMTNPKGYVSLLVRDELHEVPLNVEELKSLIMLLASVWKAKKMVTECIEVVKEKESPDLTEEEFMQEIIESGTMSLPHSIDLPWSFDTPDKKRRR
ncbi:hypothetical protein BC936DRAFT_136677, partial [Jimgerdemannia flammicorona]